MSENNYIIKFTDMNEYEQHKDKLTGQYHLITTTKKTIQVLHRLSVEEYENLKSYGIKILLDSAAIKV